jgi:hypothetical protein
MKKLLFITLLLTVSLGAMAQEQPDTTIFGLKLIGFRAGALFSRLFQDKEGRPHGRAVDILENKFRTGFTAGVSVILINAKHVSFQPEIVYNLVHHNIKYHELSTMLGNYSWSQTEADYSIDASSLQFSYMVKVKFGKIVKAYVGGGLYYDIPVYTRIKGSIRTESSNAPNEILNDDQIKLTLNSNVGLFGLSGISFPYKRSNFGLEFRVYWTPGILIDDFAFKQSFCTLNLIYQWKRKKNFW